MRKLSRRSTLKIVVIAIATAFATIPLPATTIDRFYANGLYAGLQYWVTSLSNRIPFALGDLFLALTLAGLSGWWIYRIKKARGRRLRTLALLTVNTLVVAALAYLSFLVLWGFNYQRVPLKLKLDYDEQRFSEEKRQAFCITAIERLNTDAKVAHDSSWPRREEWQSVLLETFQTTTSGLGNRNGIVPAHPKRSLFDGYFGATGITGFTNPFGLEVILNSELLPTEKPFTLAHEWAHIAGFADESEANFVALMACARSENAAIRYSGWLALFQYLPFHRSERPGTGHLPELSSEVKADLRAIDERVRRQLSPRISEAQAKVYDQFLKANRVEGGIDSYGLVARLLLGTRFESDWVPARRVERQTN